MEKQIITVLDLFSGIGGFSLGLERAGMRTIAFCEIEPFCRQVLARHWPGVPIYEDIRHLTAERLQKDGLEKIEVIAGGFPCQDLSNAGKGKGLAGERSGLWFEYARLIRELRPKYVIVENVSALRGRGLDVVLGNLAALGYDAEWHCIPASAVGAPHRRDRMWIIAYLADSSCRRCDCTVPGEVEQSRRAETVIPSATISDANSSGRVRERQTQSAGWQCDIELARNCSHLSNSDGQRLELWKVLTSDNGSQQSPVIGGGRWPSEPNICRVVNGFPYRVDRVKALGNSIVPQIAELIGKSIINFETSNGK